MSELAPVYSGGHSFAVMEPLAVPGSPGGGGGGNGFTQMFQIGGGAGAPQFIQTANGQILQVMTAQQVQPQVSSCFVKGTEPRHFSACILPK